MYSILKYTVVVICVVVRSTNRVKISLQRVIFDWPLFSALKTWAHCNWTVLASAALQQPLPPLCISDATDATSTHATNANCNELRQTKAFNYYGIITTTGKCMAKYCIRSMGTIIIITNWYNTKTATVQCKHGEK